MSSTETGTIKSFIDKESIESEKQYLVNSLGEILTVFKKINSLEINLRGSDNYKAATKNLKEYGDELKRAQKVEVEIEATRAKIEALEDKRVQQLLYEKEVLRQRTAETKNHIQVMAAEEGAINELKAKLGLLIAQYDRLSKAERESGSGEAMQKQILSITDELKQLEGETGRFQRNVGNYANSLQKPFALLQAEIAKLKTGLATGGPGGGAIVDPAAVQRGARAIEQLDKVLISAGRDGLTASQQLAILQKEFANLKASGTQNTDFLKQYHSTVLSATASTTSFAQETKKVEAENSKFSTGISKTYGVLRNLAYVLPGVGIGALVGFFFEPVFAGLGKLVDWYTEVSAAEKALALETKDLHDIQTEANKAVGEEVSNLKIIYNATQDVTLSTKERTKAAKYLQDTYPETFKNFTTEQILLGNAKQAYDDLTVSILKNALASAGKNKLATLSTERLDAYEEYATKGKSLNKEIDNLNAYRLSSDEEISKRSNLSNAHQLITARRNAQMESDARKKDLASIKKDYDDKIALIDEREKIIINFVGAENLVDKIIGKPKKTKGGGQDDELRKLLEALEAARKARLDQYQLELAEAAKFQERIFNDEKNNLTVRLNALNEYSKLKKAIVQSELDEELGQIKKEEEKSLVGIKSKKLRLAIEDAAFEKSQLARQKANAKTADLNIAAQEKVGAFYDNEFAKRVEQQKKELEAFKKKQDLLRQDALDQVDIKTNTDLIALNAEYELKIRKAAGDKRVELEKELQKKIKIITAQGELAKSLLIEATLKTQLVLLKAFGFDVTAIQKAITAEELKQSNLRKGIASDEYTHKQTLAEAWKERKEELEKQAFNTVKELGEGIFDRQKNQVQDQMDLLDKETAQKIEAVNREVSSAQDKADKIAAINAVAQARKTQLEMQQRKIDQDRAKFERALTIIEIVQNTAKAVTRDLGKPYLIAFDIAMGALQLAAVLARPIPRFKEGKNYRDSYAGPALINDGGKMEPVLRADGTLEMSNQENKLINVGAKDIVFPSVSAMLRSLASPGVTIVNSNEDMAQRIVDAVGGISITTQLVTERGHEYRNNKLTDYNNWIQRTIKK